MARRSKKPKPIKRTQAELRPPLTKEAFLCCDGDCRRATKHTFHTREAIHEDVNGVVEHVQDNLYFACFWCGNVRQWGNEDMQK